MTELAKPVAKRLQRPSWRDSRLLVGVLLVLVAASLGAKAIASADDRVPMWVAANDLVAGDPVTTDSVRQVDVRLGDDMNGYLGADAAPRDGTYVLRDVKAGELVPLSAIGRASDVTVQLVTVRADSVSTTGLARGSRVDLFVTPKTTGVTAEQKAATTKVLTAAGVASVQTTSAGFGASATTSVQLYVPVDKVQQVVEAVDSEAKLTLVPMAGSVSDAPAGAGSEPGATARPDPSPTSSSTPTLTSSTGTGTGS